MTCLLTQRSFQHISLTYFFTALLRQLDNQSFYYFQFYFTECKKENLILLFSFVYYFRRQRVLDVLGFADNAAVQRKCHLDSFQKIHRSLPSPAEHFPQSAKVSAWRRVSLSRESWSGKVLAEMLRGKRYCCLDCYFFFYLQISCILIHKYNHLSPCPYLIYFKINH